MGYRVAVVGATGNVGREMLNILAEREFPVDEIVALASRKSMGTEISFGDKTLKCKDLDTHDFTGWDIALFAVGSLLLVIGETTTTTKALTTGEDTAAIARVAVADPPGSELGTRPRGTCQARARS